MTNRQKSWVFKLEPGDVIRAKSGRLRVVRDVTHYIKYGRPQAHITLAIARCSWTHRCITVYGHTDLLLAGYRPTGVNVPLTSKIDRAIAKEIERIGRSPKEETELDCCDVRGIA